MLHPSSNQAHQTGWQNSTNFISISGSKCGGRYGKSLKCHRFSLLDGVCRAAHSTNIGFKKNGCSPLLHRLKIPLKAFKRWTTWVKSSTVLLSGVRLCSCCIMCINVLARYYATCFSVQRPAVYYSLSWSDYRHSRRKPNQYYTDLWIQSWRRPLLVRNTQAELLSYLRELFSSVCTVDGHLCLLEFI
jgi:hypothetical protein